MEFGLGFRRRRARVDGGMRESEVHYVGSRLPQDVLYQQGTDFLDRSQDTAFWHQDDDGAYSFWELQKMESTLLYPGHDRVIGRILVQVLLGTLRPADQMRIAVGDPKS